MLIFSCLKFVTSTDPELLTRLVTQRQSVRGYLPTQVPDALLRQVLTDARRAPSGSNLQPGDFLLVQGEARQRLSQTLTDAWRSDQPEAADQAYYPQPLPMTLRRRQVATAQALYGALGIARDDRLGRDDQFARNFAFFGAPVALVVTLHRDFGSAGYLDLGMAVYGLMLAAQSHGLATCAIGAIASYPELVRSSLQLDDQCAIVCGLALGYADPAAPVNQAKTTRCALDDFFRVIA
jgi:nitroreductase